MSAAEMRKAAERLTSDEDLADLDAIVPRLTDALADWLDHEAAIGEEDESMGYEIGPRYPGLVLARLINGGTE